MIARLWSSHWRRPEPVRSSLAGCELTAPEKKGWRQPNWKFKPPSSLSSVILDIIHTQVWKPCCGSYLFIHCVCLSRWFVISAGCKVGILPALPEGTDILTLPFTNIAWEHFWGMKDLGLHTYLLTLHGASWVYLVHGSQWYTKFFYRFCDA